MPRRLPTGRRRGRPAGSTTRPDAPQPHPWLRAWRERHGLQQVEAAQLFSVDKTTYARWERGELALQGTALRLAELYRDNAVLVRAEREILCTTNENTA